MKRDAFDSISERLEQNTRIYANAFHLLFMANDLVKSFEIRKCQLWRMVCFCRYYDTYILVSKLMMVTSTTFYPSISLFWFFLLRTVFMAGHLDRIFELSMSRTQYCVTSHAEKSLSWQMLFNI